MAEHFLGKDEVGSSILPMGSMSFDRDKFFDELWCGENSSQSQIELVMETISDLLDGLDWKQFDDGMEEMGGPRIFAGSDKPCNPSFSVINDILRVANPWKMATAVGLSFISMTFKDQKEYSEYLPYCESYCEFLKSLGKKKLAKDIKKRFMPA